MNNTKIYTAHELREEAAKLDEFCRVFEKKSRTPVMLRYAAEVVERCERIKIEQPFDSVINTANYILRGDAEKEGK